MIGAQEELAIGMDLLNVRESLEESIAQVLLPQSGDLIGRHLVVSEEAGDDLLALSREVELLPEAVGGGDDVGGGGGRGGESGGDAVAAVGEGGDLEVDAVEGGEGGVGGGEEVEVDGEGALLDGRSEVPAGLGSVVGIEV